jgi:hypothetical protein
VLTLDASIHIPATVTFNFVEHSAVLLNKQTNQYYMLDEVGARLWELLQDGKSLRDGYLLLLEEYEVDSSRLELDVLELLEDLKQHGLVEVDPT